MRRLRFTKSSNLDLYLEIVENYKKRTSDDEKTVQFAYNVLKRRANSSDQDNAKYLLALLYLEHPIGHLDGEVSDSDTRMKAALKYLSGIKTKDYRCHGQMALAYFYLEDLTNAHDQYQQVISMIKDNDVNKKSILQAVASFYQHCYELVVDKHDHKALNVIRRGANFYDNTIAWEKLAYLYATGFKIDRTNEKNFRIFNKKPKLAYEFAENAMSTNDVVNKYKVNRLMAKIYHAHSNFFDAAYYIAEAARAVSPDSTHFREAVTLLKELAAFSRLASVQYYELFDDYPDYYPDKDDSADYTDEDDFADYTDEDDSADDSLSHSKNRQMFFVCSKDKQKIKPDEQQERGEKDDWKRRTGLH